MPTIRKKAIALSMLIEMSLKIFPKHNFKVCCNPLDTLILLKSSSVVVTSHVLHLTELNFFFGKQFLQTEWPHLDKGIGSIIKCLSSDIEHRSSSNI